MADGDGDGDSDGADLLAWQRNFMVGAPLAELTIRAAECSMHTLGCVAGAAVVFA